MNRMYDLNKMQLYIEMKVLKWNKESFGKGTKLQIDGKNFLRRIIDKGSIMLEYPTKRMDGSVSTGTKTLYEWSHWQNREAELTILEKFYKGSFLNNAEYATKIGKELSDQLSESRTQLIAVPLFPFNELPRDFFLCRGQIIVKLTLGNPENYISTNGRLHLEDNGSARERSHFFLDVKSANLHCPKLKVLPRMWGYLEPLWQSHDIVYDNDEYEFTHFEHHPVGEIAFDRIIYPAGKDHSKTEFYLVGISEVLREGVDPTAQTSKCYYGWGNLYEVSLSRASRKQAVGGGGGKDWTYILSGECATTPKQNRERSYNNLKKMLKAADERHSGLLPKPHTILPEWTVYSRDRGTALFTFINHPNDATTDTGETRLTVRFTKAPTNPLHVSILAVKRRKIQITDGGDPIFN